MYEALRYENIGTHSLTGTNVAGSFELRQSSTPILARGGGGGGGSGGGGGGGDGRG